ncbi:MAG: Uma2 family endonuclease [Xenococcaceae cyanobacterium MO_234.B1]|nr:Uma2 family endonuclease [Xenococcaceae cyanobacterium MO_234.B1]
MTSAILSNFFQLKLKASDPEERFITSGVSWEAYKTLLESLGNSSSYRLAYLSGTLEIMSPSRSHELDKENIGRLLEAYLEENRIRFWGLGSTTFRKEDQQAGKEPDKCYCIGTDKDIPDLAIEVIYTSGGVDTLEIYRRLGVGEVWLWQNKQFQIYCLQDNSYQQKPQSQLLPDLNLALLAQYVTISDPLEAIIEWRKQVRVKDSH